MRNAEAVRDAFLDAYIRENPRPDCLPEYRFRATLPGGTMAWRGTREESVAAILEAIEP